MDQNFKEVQKLRQFWIWGVLVLLISVMSATLYYGILKYIGDCNLINIVILVVVSLIEILVVCLIILTKLDTEINYQSISIKMTPFHLKPRVYNWEDVEKVSIRKYRPIVEYGGWGIRMSMNGLAYNISGNMGMQLELKNKKMILIGTQKAEELNQFLTSIGKI